MKQYIWILLLLLTGCKKYLDQKPDAKLQLPTTVISVQGLLDNESTFNTVFPGSGEVSADNYYVTDATYNATSSQPLKNTYIWGDDITGTDFPNGWSRCYDMVSICNVALESLDKIAPGSNPAAWNNVKGSALFLRSRAFLTVTGYFTKAYDAATAGNDMGIPLRLSSDYNVVSTRSSLQAGYDQVTGDLKTAAPLLPVTPVHVLRPSRPAAYALLARTYLLMNNYDSALAYANRCLALNSTLMNYNTLLSSAAYPFPLYNSEVIMHTIMSTPQILGNTRAIVDSALYKSYDASDLRKTLFFKANTNGTMAFRGSYNQSAALFNGVATDEVYLVQAECLARTGKLSEAMTALNALLVTRWKTNSFIPFSAADKKTALGIILAERRKELLFRDLRWMDLKRLNRETDWQVTLRRKLNGVDYTLPPEDNRYALPIPASVIAISGMAQNPR